MSGVLRRLSWPFFGERLVGFGKTLVVFGGCFRAFHPKIFVAENQ